MNKKNLFLGCLLLALTMSVPGFVSAATSKAVQSASFNKASLVVTSNRPSVSGEADGVSTVRINIYKEGEKKLLFKSKSIKVVRGEWNTRLTKSLPVGTYDIKVYGPRGVTKNTLSVGTLTIGSGNGLSVLKADTTLVVEALPLLAGGTARLGSSIPVSYLQVTNIGKEAATVKGFWIKQSGTASVESVIGFSTVDDTGTLKASTGTSSGVKLFKNGTAFVPVQNIVVPAGQIKLVTIKANITTDISSHVGTSLVIDVTGIDIAAKIRATFPIRGTIWNLAR